MGKVAALAIILMAGGVLFLIAKAEGVDFGSEWSDLTDKFNSEVATAGADLGVSDDPVSIAIPIIKNFESFAAHAYPDPPNSGKFSIGYGHQIKPGEPYGPDSTISQDEAEQLLRIDIGGAYNCVSQNVTADLSPNQTAALISFAYNVGCGAFRQSTMLRLLNDGDIEGAAAQFPQWIHAGGLVNTGLVSRRDQEQELFNS
jgi:lysozyme